MHEYTINSVFVKYEVRIFLFGIVFEVHDCSQCLLELGRALYEQAGSFTGGWEDGRGYVVVAMDGLCNFQQAISSRPEIPEDFGGAPTQLPAFIAGSTKEQIAYSLGTPGTAVDFIPQKSAEFSTVITSLYGASIGIEV